MEDRVERKRQREGEKELREILKRKRKEKDRK